MRRAKRLLQCLLIGGVLLTGAEAAAAPTTGEHLSRKLSLLAGYDTSSLTLQAELLVEAPEQVQRAWDPHEFRDQILKLLPGEALEDVARSFVDKRVQVRLDRDQAFLSLRIPLG